MIYMERTDDDEEEEQQQQDEKEDGLTSYNNKFPRELREEMIGRVASVTHLFKLRLVCKAWNAVITSPDLAQLHAAHRHREVPWLLVARFNHTRRPLAATHYMECRPLLHLVCDPRSSRMQQWIAPPLPFLAAHSCDLSTCQSHRGLVCCLASTKPGRCSNTVLIFNPITRAYKLLPSPSNGYAGGFWWPSATRRSVQHYDNEGELPSADVDVALWRSSTSSGAHFRVSVCQTATREVRVFDSRKGHWKEGSRAPGRLKPRFQGFRGGSSGAGNQQQQQDTLYWYDVEVDTWYQTSLPLPPVPHAALKWPSVFKDGATATLMLAAVLVQRRGGAVIGFGIWARHGSPPAAATDNGGNCGRWVRMASTPAGVVQGRMHRLRDSKLMCHPQYVCMTGLLRFSLWPWKSFYPWILSFHAQQQQQQRDQAACWEWSSQPLGPKTWANFQVLSLLDPTLLSIP